MKKEIRLSGSGGQGVILASVILGKAASIYDNMCSLQSQSYGPEARGGATKSDIIISDSDIMYPKVRTADYLLSLTQEAADKYSPLIKAGGKMLIDSDFITMEPSNEYDLTTLPLSSATMKEFDKLLTLNIVSLSAFNTIFSLVSDEALEHATIDSVPDGFTDLNRTALALGRSIVENNA